MSRVTSLSEREFWMRISDYVIKHLENIGVEYVFGLSGGQAAGLNDAFFLSKIKYISCHHEQGAGYAAIGYAKQTGKLGVVNPTSGCAGTNCITPVLDAWQDSVPVLFLSGNAPLKHLDIGIQGNDIIPIVKPITKFAAMIQNPTAALYLLQQAINEATSLKKGPVWLDFPIDIQNKVMKPEDFSTYVNYNYDVPLSIKDKDILFTLLQSAERPLMLVGNGIHVAGVESELNQFITRYPMPVVSTYLGIDLLSNNPLYVGSIGIKGSRAGNFAVDNCDLLLVLGCCLNVPEIGYDIERFAQQAKICIVDIEEKKHIKPYVFIRCDLTTFFKGLL